MSRKNFRLFLPIPRKAVDPLSRLVVGCPQLRAAFVSRCSAFREWCNLFAKARSVGVGSPGAGLAAGEAAGTVRCRTSAVSMNPILGWKDVSPEIFESLRQCHAGD